MVDFKNISQLNSFAIRLLQQLISVPSPSRQEDKTADLLQDVFRGDGIHSERVANNVWAKQKTFDAGKPTLLLNSHHDTVPPNQGYTRNPYDSSVSDGRIFGLGSNDAGGALVCLLSAFLHFYNAELPFNIVFGASAEEEVSGKNGVELLLQHLPRIDMAIVGEPTGMDMAIAEKGLLVLDGVAHGRAGHAARNEGENALYKALDDIQRLRNFRFEKHSHLLGDVHLAVTAIETKNKSHNVVPDECSFVVDVRVNEKYTFEEILAALQAELQSKISPRSLRLNPSSIPDDHPLVKAGLNCGMQPYGSPTLSDMALMNFPAIKSGPGQSARSHTPDEFIYIKELEDGIAGYIRLVENLCETIKN